MLEILFFIYDGIASNKMMVCYIDLMLGNLVYLNSLANFFQLICFSVNVLLMIKSSQRQYNLISSMSCQAALNKMEQLKKLVVS